MTKGSRACSEGGENVLELLVVLVAALGIHETSLNCILCRVKNMVCELHLTKVVIRIFKHPEALSLGAPERGRGEYRS